jgi:hypothetical protein
LIQHFRVAALVPGTILVHADDSETKNPQPERVFRVVEVRKRTVIVENGIGVRTSMSKETEVVPLPEEVWARVARPGVAAPLAAPLPEQKIVAG